MALVEPGIRVVRGPDWKWEQQDGGLGHLGTIVPFEKTDPNKPSVEVRWDRGLRGDYRIGYQDAFDLRLFDNGTVGVNHSDIRCDVCQKSPIFGIRWKCKNIDNYNLCSSCYHGSKANIRHQFFRIVVPGATGILMEKRILSRPIEVKGLFPGAKVRVGSDLTIDKDDVRNHFKGTVKRLEAWEPGFPKTGAVVNWPPDMGLSRYRVGYRGMMDLKTKDPSVGGFCYLNHLPVLGHPIQMERVDDLIVGDHVTISMEVDVLRELQEGHGDWVPEMADAIGQVGVICDITSNQDLMVEYPKSCRKWIFHPAALTKVSRRLSSIREVDESGDYSIELYKPGQRSDIKTVSPNSATHEFTAFPESSDQRGNVRIHEVSMRIGLEKSADLSEVVAIAAAQGEEQNVRDILKRHPEWVNSPCNEKSPLQLAVHGGFLHVAEILIAAGAELNKTDEDGDTALMFAIYGNHPEIVKFLLSKGALINLVNNERRSALHQAVTRGFIGCIKELLAYQCNVNIQDNFGDTALHDAINGQNKAVLSLLFENGGINFKLSNKREFNALQWAAMKGNQFAVQRMLVIEPGLAGIRNVDGQTALHIAARNNFPDIVRILIVKGECSVNEYTNDDQTPLLLAVRAGHIEVVEALLNLRADVNMPDSDGDTSLHVALLRQVIFPDVGNTIFLEKIRARIPDQSVATSGLALACLLVEHKADLHHVNNKGQTPLDIVPDTKIHAVLRHFIPEAAVSLGQSDRGSAEPEASLKTNVFGTLSSQNETEQERKQREKIEYFQDQVRPRSHPDDRDNRLAESRPGDGENRDASPGGIGGRKTPERKDDAGGGQEHILMQQEKERQCRLAPSWSLPVSDDVAMVKGHCASGLGDGDAVQTPTHIAKQQMEERQFLRDRQEAFYGKQIAEDNRGQTPEHIAKQEIEERQLGANRQSGFQDKPFAGGPSSSRHGEDNRGNMPEHLAKQHMKERQLSGDHPALHIGSAVNGNLERIPGQNLDHIAMQSAKERQTTIQPLVHPEDEPSTRHHPPHLDLSPQRQQHLVPNHPGSETTPSPISYQSTPTPTTLPPNLARCQLGCGSIADAQFQPCCHTTVCRKCSECFKLCHVCRRPIETISQQSRAFPAFSNTDPGMGQQTPRSAAVATEGATGKAADRPSGARRKIFDSNSDLTKSILIQKYQKLEEELVCPICWERRRELVFMCGHSLCEECTDAIDDCPYCRTPILKKIKIY